MVSLQTTILALVSLVLTGCATLNVELPKASAPAPVYERDLPKAVAKPAPPPMQKIAVKVVYVPYTKLVVKSDNEYLAEKSLQSFVVFTRRPASVQELTRYQEVCRAWRGSAEVADSEELSQIKAEGFVPTPLYWLTEATTVAEAKARDCRELIKYDFKRAARLIAKIKRDTGKSLTKGPYVVLQQDTKWLVLDLALFKDTEVFRAFDLWREQVSSHQPTEALVLSELREALKNLLQNYSGAILKILEKG